MEKYRQFADGGTGVNPFVPEWSHYRMSLPKRMVKVLVMFPIALVRMAIVTLAVLWLCLSHAICILLPLGFVRYPIYRVLTYVGCAIGLLGLGVMPTPGGEVLADHRRLKLAPPKKGGGRTFDATRGALVLANQQSIVDVFYLGMKLCPTFAFVASDGSPVELSLLGALRHSCARFPSLAQTRHSRLEDILLRARAGWWGPVVLFPEGARTNGSCVLTWNSKTFEGLTSFDKPYGTALVSIVYSKTGAYTPHHTVGSGLRHIFFMCLQPWHTVVATWLPTTDVAAAAQGKSLEAQIPLLRTLLVRMVPRAVEVDVGAEKHLGFMDYWETSQSKAYTQQQRKKRA